MQFTDFDLIQPLLKAVAEQGYETPTPIQCQAIPHLLAGRDILGCAQTGTGKTAAFALPILHRLHQADTNRKDNGDGKTRRPIRALILSPTRELAQQIGDSFADYGRHLPLRHTTIYGGVRQGSQVTALKKGVDILVATPGRLMDLQQQGHVKLGQVEIFVLDEADRMLDMGFINDVRKITRMLPGTLQSLLFSATMPYEIQHLADSLLRDPVEVRIAPEAPAAETVDQRVYLVETANKQALMQHLLECDTVTRALVFTRTKSRADRVGRMLKTIGIPVEIMHSDRPQAARKVAMERFVAGKVRVLVASDIAARGIDIDDISHVVNFDMPNDAETYIHRIGRTGRAGQSGIAWSFCSMEERIRLDEIEKLLGRPVEVTNDHPFPSPLPRASARKKAEAVAVGTSPWKRPSRRRRL
jgi:ATP-dependent RNA helicase RhlE